MKDEKSQRAWVYVLVGAYLLYTAWQLFQGLGDSEGNQAVIAVFTVLFVVAGVALIWFGVRTMRKGSAQEGSAQEGSAQEGSVKTENGEADKEGPEDVSHPADCEEKNVPDDPDRGKEDGE